MNEPSVEDAVKILPGLKTNYEKHHKVRYTPEAIRAAVELSAKYIHDRKLPDKAIDVIDEVGASRMLQPEGKRRKTVTLKDVEEIVAKIARIPPKTVSNDDKETLRTLERDLKSMVFGQEKAIEALSSAIKLSRAGLRDAEKPIGNYLFSGPTGVGKTEVAKQLAKTLGIELIRFDMSEYMERHSISRLIGAPPGYVGFDQGGLLTDSIDQHPHAVLLLDEIEKAHQDLYNILLQVMDHGKLTDHNGKTVDFRNVILIMTTNAGASDMAKPAIGFGRERPHRRGYRGDPAHVHPGIPQPAGRGGALRRPDAGDRRPGGREVRHAAGGPARRPERDHRAVLGRQGMAGGEGLRSAVRRPAAGPGHPGVHQEAARRGIALRQAGQGWLGQGQPARRRPGLRLPGSRRARPAEARGRARRWRGGEGAGGGGVAFRLKPGETAWARGSTPAPVAIQGMQPMTGIKDWDAYNAAARVRGKELNGLHPELVKGFGALARGAATTQHLDAKTRELIALAVAVTTRCDGCIDAHVRKAKVAGASKAEMAEALGVAIALNAGAAFTYSLHVLDAAGDEPASAG